MSMKIAVIGTGKVARNNYLPFLSKEKDVVLTYFSRTRSKAEACAQAFGGRVVEAIDDIHANDPDAILVLTPETQRYAVTTVLLQGKPKRLFFEKPLVAQHGQDKVCEDDFHKATDLLQRAKRSGTETAMVFNYRFFEQTVRMKRIIDDRGFGELIHAAMFVNYACWSHCIDLLHFFGGRASQISALAGDIRYKDAVDVSGAFCLVNGATGTILGTNGSPFAFPLYQIVMNFERGTIRFGDLDGPMDVYDTTTRYRETHTLIGNHSRWEQYNSSFEKSLGAYLDSIRQNEPPPVPGIAGLEELQFEVALRRSIAQKRPVDVQAEFPIEI
jgi:predicted dehydrogenase